MFCCIFGCSVIKQGGQKDYQKNYKTVLSVRETHWATNDKGLTICQATFILTLFYYIDMTFTDAVWVITLILEFTL